MNQIQFRKNEVDSVKANTVYNIYKINDFSNEQMPVQDPGPY